VERRGIK